MVSGADIAVQQWKSGSRLISLHRTVVGVVIKYDSELLIAIVGQCSALQ